MQMQDGLKRITPEQVEEARAAEMMKRAIRDAVAETCPICHRQPNDYCKRQMVLGEPDESGIWNV